MNVNAVFVINLAVMLAALGVMAANTFLYQLPDWCVQSSGFVILVDLAVGAYTAVRLKKTE